jgi:uncharacterized membrane protein
MEDLGTLRGHLEGVAESINDKGQIAGYSSDVDYYDASDMRAVLWDPGTGIVDLSGCANVCWAQALAINEEGQIAGGFSGKVFRWSRSDGLNLVNAWEGWYSAARGINSLGYLIVNQYYGSDQRAFVGTPEGESRALGVLPGAASTIAAAINNKGQIVGSSW